MLPIILGLSGPSLNEADRSRLVTYQPAGLILFTRNIVDCAQVRALTDDVRSLLRHTPLIGIDNEGGRVWRTSSLGPTPPDAATFASQADFKKAAQFGASAGRQLEMLGINLDFAPVLDIDHHAQDANALRGRCWGRESQSIIDFAGNFNRWLRKNGILSCGKHFPAGGRARVDPHHDLPVVDATLEELLRSDLIPYTALMPELDAIMIAHIHYPQIDADYPSSLSHRIITRLLREQLGYRGLILTDDLDMGAVTGHFGRGPDFELAWLAGNDLPLLCHELDSVSVVAKVYESLPSSTRIDIEKRLDKTHRQLPPPPPFDSLKLEQLHLDLADLTEAITGTRTFQPIATTQSPVEDY